MPTMEREFPLFQALPEGESTPYGNFCALGENWPHNAPLHPALGELYAQREDRIYFECITSTVNGVRKEDGDEIYLYNQ